MGPHIVAPAFSVQTFGTCWGCFEFTNLHLVAQTYISLPIYQTPCFSIIYIYIYHMWLRN